MTNRAKGSRKGKRARHISLTDMASEIYSQLLSNGIVAYPGPITSRGGGGAETRVTLTIEEGRHRITVVHSGTQMLFVYGAVDKALLERILKRFVGDKLTIRCAKG